jgi:hypothetical protein
VRRGPFAFGILVLLVPSLAWAEGERARLELTRDAETMTCPDEQALSDAVASRLGYDPFDAGAAPGVSVHFLRDGKTLRAVVEMRTAAGEPKGARALASSALDCQELAEATALTISILLDPRSGLGPRPPRPPPATTPQEVPDLSHPKDPTAAPDAAPPPPREERPGVHLRLVAHATGSINLLPAPTAGVLAGAGLEGRRWSADVELRVDASASHVYSGHEVSASFFAGELAPCVLVVGPLRACGVVVIGAIQAEVNGASQGRQSAFMVLVGPRLGGALRLTSWLSLDAHLDFLYAPTEMTAEVDKYKAWSTSPVSGLLGLGLVGRIP